MRRYLPLLFVSFLLIVVVVTGTFIASQAGRQNPAAVKSIVIYTDLPVEQASVLAQAYEKAAAVRVVLVPLSPADIIAKARMEAGDARADLILAGTDTLEKTKKNQLLAPYASEQTDIIPDRFTEPDNFWLGVWHDPIVFAANKDYLKKQPNAPAKWADLVAVPGPRLAITDFLAAEAAANLLYSMAAAEGEEQTLAYLAKVHPKVVQYAKFLATPSRMAGMGEADIAVTVLSEATRYVQDGFPIQVITPTDATATMVTAVGLAANAPHAAEATKFIDWLITDAAQSVLRTNRFFLIPTNPESTLAKDNNVKNIKLFEYKTALTPEQKTKLLDMWVQTVRLAPR